jgi:hypothetical protein
MGHHEETLFQQIIKIMCTRFYVREQLEIFMMNTILYNKAIFSILQKAPAGGGGGRRPRCA